jgi:ATP-dependent Clp protease ATP-binding subunit ClpA
VGETGVGKTTIAEGLAKRIVDSEVPEVLSAATVFSLDMGFCARSAPWFIGCSS